MQCCALCHTACLYNSCTIGKCECSVLDVDACFVYESSLYLRVIWMYCTCACGCCLPVRVLLQMLLVQFCCLRLLIPASVPCLCCTVCQIRLVLCADWLLPCCVCPRCSLLCLGLLWLVLLLWHSGGAWFLWHAHLRSPVVATVLGQCKAGMGPNLPPHITCCWPRQISWPVQGGCCF